MRRMPLALLLLAQLAVVVGGPPEAQRVPPWVRDLSGTQLTAAQIPWRESTTAPASTSVGSTPPAFTFPAAQKWQVTLGGSAQPGKPVEVISAAAGKTAQVEVLDRAAAQKIGASGFAFTLSKLDAPARVSVGYSAFASAYGAGYADRLQLAQLPKCVLDGCGKAGRRIASTNDRAAGKLTADLASSDGESVFAVVSGVSGEQGTFAATSLSLTGNWQVTPGSGAFSYSHPVDVPQPGGGTAPTVAMSYSSSAIDGMTLATNTQASPIGVGWSDFGSAYIERRYEQCYKIHLADMCWINDNAILSLGGVSGPLFPVNSPANTEWKLQSDPGWRIERNGNAQYTTIYGNQSWKVTGPDGTIYIFGGGHMPGRQTNSILGVPVYADNTGEPCRGQNDTLSGCEQGWRWYLDRVIDPDGNETAYLYEREENIYSALGGIGNLRYHRGALLSEIIYGGRDWNSATYSARVRFVNQNRCYYLVEACPPATPNHTGFPDAPTDLICTSMAQGTCAVHTPSFFTTKRYASVVTEVKAGTVWNKVSEFHIRTGWGEEFAADGVARKLQVREIQQQAHVGGAANQYYPSTRFGYKVLDNRADHSGNIPKAMRHLRIDSVTNPFGGVTSVVYGRNRGCSTTYNPDPRWDTNIRDCFPQAVKDNDFTGTGIYNKYLVMSVSENDGFTAEAMKTTYTYEGDPAWGFDFGAIARDDTKIGWSQWRGYGQVVIRKGSSATRLILFRGWHHDHVLKDVGGGSFTLGDREWSVTASDGSAFADEHALAGRTLEEQELGTVDGVAGSVRQRRIYRYSKRILNPMPGNRFPIEWAGLASTTEGVATALNIFRERRSQTTYNASLQPTATVEEGWLSVSGDERCSITTYAENAARNMYVYPAVNKKLAGDCGSTTVLSQSQTFYDNSTTLGVVVDRGNPTMQRVQLDAGSWAQTLTEFDVMGRPVKVTGPVGDTVTTAYAPAAGGMASHLPARTTVTNALGHSQITDYRLELGAPLRQQDANGNVTAFEYDAFGRTTKVWLPTETPGSANPSWQFSYDLANRSIRSRQLTSCCTTVTYEDTWVVYDGLWRQRQAQGRSTDSAKVLVSETTYDNRGQVYDQTVAQALPGTHGKYVNGGTAWLNRTRNTYDELGRVVAKEWQRPGTPGHTTTTSYTVDTVTVTGPDGHRAAEKVDGLGRIVAAEESSGSTLASTSYRYDLADNLISVTDPAGVRVDYTYNMAGWRTGQSDPDRGGAAFGYDAAGRQTAVLTASGVVYTTYDALGRPLQRRADATDGPLLASWQYDTAPKGKGKPHRQTNASGWVTEVAGYDARGRVTGNTLVVPAGIAGISGSYSVQHTYDLADRARSVSLPAIGGLPAETVTTDYSALGLITRVGGLEEYVSALGYDDRGRRTSAAFGPRPGGTAWMAKTWTFNVDQRTHESQTFVNGAGIVSDHRMAFHNSGNLKEDLVVQNGLSWRECFGYDTRARLISAHTVAATAVCETGTPGTGGQPYRHGYAYSADGKLLERTENGVATAYTYPAAGGLQPHAPTRVGNDTYSWDAEGKLATRNVAGQAETFSWDKQDRLTSVTAAAGVTSFVYDPSGQRLMRRAPNGNATLYFSGHEITVSASGAPVQSVRSYGFDGMVVATRTLQGVDYLVSGPGGSVEMAYRSGAVTPSATRAYLPYGRVRAETGDTATDRGFLGQVEDPSTRLSYLNDRYYDTAAGVFLSADALFDTAKIKTLNPYSYASNNPATLSDPSGMYSAGAFGTEVQNATLRKANKDLIAHIGRLNDQIVDMQAFIYKQIDAINKMMTYVSALEAEIDRQASIIRRLEARVAKLERQVLIQQMEIGRLNGIIARQDRELKEKARIIGYYKGITDVLGYRLWGGSPFHERIMDSIHSFRGIPWYGFLVDKTTILQGSVYRLQSTVDEQAGKISRYSSTIFNLSEQKRNLREEFRDVSAELAGLKAEIAEDISNHDIMTMTPAETACHYGTSSGNLWEGSPTGGTGADIVDAHFDVFALPFQFFGGAAVTNIVCDGFGVG